MAEIKILDSLYRRWLKAIAGLSTEDPDELKARMEYILEKLKEKNNFVSSVA